ncbi:MAG: DUF1573 domain-containing protein [Bacteroidota bacterium]|nr:DUF1573 domain-containing protein [Bacteroidota bacterium]
MKTAFITVLAFVFAVGFSSCAPKEKKVTTDLVNINDKPVGKDPVMKFETEVHDFGKISQGERVSYSFKFKNTGGSDLIIYEAHGSCGCTVPQFPKDPVGPGEEEVINVEFNSEGKREMQEKTVTLTTNCSPNTKVITIKANVVVPDYRGGK